MDTVWIVVERLEEASEINVIGVFTDEALMNEAVNDFEVNDFDSVWLEIYKKELNSREEIDESLQEWLELYED